MYAVTFIKVIGKRKQTGDIPFTNYSDAREYADDISIDNNALSCTIWRVSKDGYFRVMDVL